MARSIDAVTRAYATLGVRPGASARELKLQYKRLVRQWHPDRWARDPVNQAEAAQRMRAINDAYETLDRLHTPVVVTDQPDDMPPRDAPARPAPVRPLTEAERNAIVDAIGNDSPVSHALSFVAWFGPIVAALIPLTPAHRGSPPTRGAWIEAVVLVSIGLVVRLLQKTKAEE